jgi:rare lipoprotein A
MIRSNLIFRLILGLLSIVIVSCSSSVRFTSSKTDLTKTKESAIYTGKEKVFTGKASYYGEKFHDRQTSSGEIYDMTKMTAAHRFLPFNSKVKVTNLINNKSVVVKINDRGPFVDDRIIDLSKEAAERLDMLNYGVIDVRLELLEE